MKVVITANGEGSRMKGLSPLPKHELYFGDKKIIDYLLYVFPGAEVLTGFPSNSRRETLERIKDYEDCLIVDCDIMPLGFIMPSTKDNFLFYFKSNKEKYSSIVLGDGGKVAKVSETIKISDNHCSGIYFVKSVANLLEKMTDDNSIASGMIGAWTLREDYIVKVGDPSDYYEALGIKPTSFTGNKITFNEKTVIKHCKTGILEGNWLRSALAFNCPKVYHADEEMIITERIYQTDKPTAEDFIRIIEMFKETEYASNGLLFNTYLRNIPNHWAKIILKPHKGTFFHGDLSTHNVLKNSRIWLIDPNYKDIFGSWLTDAGKAFFSFVAYEQDYPEAKKISDHFGPDVINFAVAEGLRVCKYKPEYISIVNNIAELCRQ